MLIRLIPSILVILLLLSISFPSNAGDHISKIKVERIRSQDLPYDVLTYGDILRIAYDNGRLFRPLDNQSIYGFKVTNNFEEKEIMWNFSCDVKAICGIQYFKDYLLLETKHKYIIISAKTGQLVTEFKFNKGHIKLDELAGKIVLKFREFSKHTRTMTIKFLNLQNRQELQSSSFILEDNIDWYLQGNIVYTVNSDSSVMAKNIQGETIWTTEPEEYDWKSARIFSISKDKLGVCPYSHENPNLFIVNKSSGEILKIISLRNRGSNDSDLFVISSEEFFFTGGKYISMYSKDTIEKLKMIQNKSGRTYALHILGGYLIKIGTHGMVEVYNKDTLEVLCEYEVPYIRDGGSVKKVIFGPDNSFVTYMKYIESSAGDPSEWINIYLVKNVFQIKGIYQS
jgi:hypothetical protein